MKKASFPDLLRRSGAAVLLTAGIFWLTYTVVMHFQYFGLDYIADYLQHAVTAVGLTSAQFFASLRGNNEYLWHGLVKLVYLLCGNMFVSAAIVTAAANAAAYFLFFRIFDQALPERFPRWLLAVLTAVVFVAAPLYFPGSRLYVGAPNTWHNPTNIMVRPFALAVFFMTVRIYNRRLLETPSIAVGAAGNGAYFSFCGGFWAEFRRPVYAGAELVLYPLCLLLSVWAKPSFLQFFAPAIFLFLLIDVVRTRGMLLPFCLKLALAYLPAVLVLFSQFFRFFGGNVAVTEQAVAAATDNIEAASAGVAVYFSASPGAAAFFETLRSRAVNILRLSAFPLLIVCAAPRRFFSDTAGRLSFFGAAVGRLELMLLHETGSRAAHGNFSWGCYLAVWLFWGVAMQRYILLFRERSAAGRVVRWIGTPLLVWHLVSGIVYCVLCVRTGGFYF